MITDLRPYFTYKPSGVEWLGSVPEHWDVVPLKRIGDFGGGTGFPLSAQGNTTEEILFAKVSDMNRRGNERRITSTANTVSREVARTLGARVFPPSSVIFPKVGGALLTNKRRILSRDTCIDNNLMGCVAKETDPEFVFLMMTWLDLARMRKPGPVPAISEGEVREIRVTVPPRSEQAAIVRFLDHADWFIRRYIRAKQTLIAVLKEQKEAIIHQAVTGQIDVHTGQPYAAYKPSGVEWLQKVPTHWETISLRRRWRVIDCKHLTVPFVDDGIPLASVREAQSFELNLQSSNRTTFEWYEKLIEGGREPRRGDLIYCRNVSVGAAALVATDALFAMGQDVCLIRSSIENQRWLNYFLHSKVMSDQLALLLVGSTFNRINVADIKALSIVVPPLSQQDRIASYLDDELSKIDVAIGTCRKEQALVHEYRTRLIADVVTGNLDVREAATELPEKGDPGDPVTPRNPYGETQSNRR